MEITLKSENGIIDEQVRLVPGLYTNGGLAIQAVCLDGEPYCTLTVCLPEWPLAGCVWLKLWDGQKGFEKCLEDAGVVRLTGRTCQTGYETAYEAEVLAELKLVKRKDKNNGD